MHKLVSLLLLAATAITTSCSRHFDSPDAQAAYALAERVTGKAAGFVFKTLPADSCDYFVLRQEGRKVSIGGNNANSMAVGLNYYLRYHCGVNIGWFAWDKGKMPRHLPEVPEPVQRNARNLLTSWGDRGNLLTDYADRSWSGLVGSYYKGRWELFFEAIDKALAAGEKLEGQRAEALLEAMKDFEYGWWAGRSGSFPSEPTGNVTNLVQACLQSFE